MPYCATVSAFHCRYLMYLVSKSLCPNHHCPLTVAVYDWHDVERSHCALSPASQLWGQQRPYHTIILGPKRRTGIVSLYAVSLAFSMPAFSVLTIAYR